MGVLVCLYDNKKDRIFVPELVWCNKQRTLPEEQTEYRSGEKFRNMTDISVLVWSQVDGVGLYLTDGRKTNDGERSQDLPEK